MYKFTKKYYVCCPWTKCEQREREVPKSKTNHSRDKHSSPLFSMPFLCQKKKKEICAMPRIVSVSSLVDMLTQWFEFPLLTWCHQLICSCSDKLAKHSSVSLQRRKTEGSRKTSMIAPHSSLKLISSSKSEEGAEPKNLCMHCTAFCCRLHFKRK